MIEKVPGVERAVAQEFVGRSVKLIRAVSGNDVYLRTGTFAVFGAVSVFDNREFPHGVYAEKLSTQPARRVVHFGSTGELDSVEQEQIFLRASA
jgi:hypothetical protein